MKRRALPPDVYPGPLQVWKKPDLTRTERQIEQRYTESLQSDLTFSLREYRLRYGRILDTDLARGLSDDWNRNKESRARYASAVHNPASAFVDALYQAILAEPREGDRNLVLFMAGGGGSGKTTAVTQVASSLMDRAHLVYDTTLARYEPALQKIEAALVAGREVVIVFVYRPFEAAVRGVIQRASNNGRTIPLNVLAADHAGASESVLRLAEAFAGNERVLIYVIDNSSEDVRQAHILSGKSALDFLAKIRHNETEALTHQAEEILTDEIQKRRETIHALPNNIVASFRRYSRRRAR
jgi:hypothetical protein